MSTIATAQALRRRAIDVAVPGTDTVIRCRRPDLLGQMMRGLLPAPLVDAVFKRASGDAGIDPAAITADTATHYAEFIDRWVCLAAVQPRIVLTEAEATDDVVWVEDLDLTVKLAILHATRLDAPATDAAVAEFRGDESAGGSVGSDSAALRDAAVDPVTH